MARRVVLGKTALVVCTSGARENSDAVVGLLAEDGTVIAGRLQLELRKLVVRALCFLNAEHVGLRCPQPPRDVRQTRNDRVDVPGSDFHVRTACGSGRALFELCRETGPPATAGGSDFTKSIPP